MCACCVVFIATNILSGVFCFFHHFWTTFCVYPVLGFSLCGVGKPKMRGVIFMTKTILGVRFCFFRVTSLVRV